MVKHLKREVDPYLPLPRDEVIKAVEHHSLSSELL
jgi:hypothetical protein